MHEKLDELDGRLEDIAGRIEEAEAGIIEAFALGLILGAGLVALTALRVIKRRR